MAVTETATADVKSAWLSKINWNALLNVAFVLLTAFGLDIPDALKIQIMAVASAVGGLVTIIFKTWFTTSITPSSAAKL